MSTEKLLITGAYGFTGRHLLSAASQHGLECTALCHSDDPNIAGGQVEHNVIAADLLDAGSLLSAVEKVAPDFVIHLAAQANVASGDLRTTYQTNLIGSLNLLEAVRTITPNLQRVILASSANLYGRVTQLPITEETPVNPTNHYAVSKWAMEMAANLFESLPVVTVRPFNYTGVGQSTDFVVPKIVEAFATRSDSLTLGKIDVYRDFSDVRDVALDYLALLHGDVPRLVNLCSGKATSIRQLIEMLESISGHRLTVHSSEGLLRSGEIDTLYGQPNPFLMNSARADRIPLDKTLTWMHAAAVES